MSDAQLLRWLAPDEPDDDTPELCDCGHHPVDCKCDPDYDERD